MFAIDGKKLLVALAIERKFASEGLQAIDGDDDILTAMDRELVQDKGIGESTDSVWRSLGALQPATSRQIEEEPSLKEEDLAFSADDRPEPIANSALVEMLTPNLHASRRDADGRHAVPVLILGVGTHKGEWVLARSLYAPSMTNSLWRAGQEQPCLRLERRSPVDY